MNEKNLRDAAKIKERDRDVEEKCIEFLEKTYNKGKYSKNNKGKYSKSLMECMYEMELFHVEKLLIAATRDGDDKKAVAKSPLDDIEDVEKKCLDILKKELKTDDIDEIKIKWKDTTVYNFKEPDIIEDYLKDFRTGDVSGSKSSDNSKTDDELKTDDAELKELKIKWKKKTAHSFSEPVTINSRLVR